jgi:hypothetical protein
MKNRLLIASALVIASFTTPAMANDRSAALNQCKSFVGENFPEADLRKVTSIKTHGKTTKIKFRIVEGEEKIKGLCKVAKGELSFAKDGVEMVAANGS